MVRVILVVAALGALLAVGAEPRDQFQWPGWQIPAGKTDAKSALAIVADEGAESKRTVKGEDGQEKVEATALIARVSRREIAKTAQPLATTPLIPWADLVPGVYRVSARVKYAGDANVIGTPVVLAVDTPLPQNTRGPSQHVAQAFQSFDLGPGDTWTEISILYEADPTLAKRLPARTARHSWQYGGFLREAYPEYQPPEPKTPLGKPLGVQLSVFLPQTKYSAKTGMPPNSLRSLSLDWVKFERIQPSPGLTVRYVRARKRWLRPGEEQTFDVAVENFTPAACSRTVVLTLVTGLDVRREVARVDVDLPPGAQKVWSVPWPTTAETPIWGYEIRAESRQGEQVESVAHDVFSLHPRVYFVHLMGSNYRTEDPFRQRENLANLMEVFAATPGDCAQVLPTGEQWLSGMSVVPQSFKIVRATTDYNKSIGVATHMYLFAGGTGEAVMDMYVRHPEYLASRPGATDEVYEKRQETAEMVRQHDFRKGPVDMPNTPHIEEHLNHWFPELMDQVTRDTLEFVRRTGYQGIRFDVGIFAPKLTTTVLGTPLPFKPEDKMTQAAANFNHYQDALRAQDPNFEFGANMDSWAYLENVGQRNAPAPPPEKYPEFVAFARAGGMFMDEGTMCAPLYNHYMNRFEDALWGMCQKRAVTRRFGGVYQLFSPHRDGNGYFAHDDIYWTIMIIASGSYYVGKFSAAPDCADSPGEFITRFSEFFRSPGLQPLPDAEDAIAVDAPVPLWYADPTVYEDRGPLRRYVIPLINPPVNDRLRRNKNNELPPPVTEPFPVTVKVPAGYQRARATMLTWEPRVAAVPLEAHLAGGAVHVKVPGIKLFRTLVIEFEK